MSVLFLIITLLFIVISGAMILIILVQRPQGGGLVGAFGGAGGGGTETVFGGRVGDALTWATVGAFVLYLGVAISLNKIESAAIAAATTDQQTAAETTTSPPTGTPPATTSPAQPRPTVTGGDGEWELREPQPGEELPEDLRRAFEEHQRQQREGQQP
jgi:preprotein translocase subunit SecG